MKILFVQTGGTIDKDYARKAKTYDFEISTPAVKRVLERIRPNFEYRVISVLKKDSMDMSAQDRDAICEAVRKVPEDKIIVTHGTDTMTKTAECLSKIGGGKTIVLTGSSLPEKFYDSDASFNIGVALGAISALKPGVYVAMNGRAWDWNKVQKREDGMFVER
ncbi:MAG: asparaginase domain-containing protein [Candidatus Diapherotrites archaeon]